MLFEVTSLNEIELIMSVIMQKFCHYAKVICFETNKYWNICLIIVVYATPDRAL